MKTDEKRGADSQHEADVRSRVAGDRQHKEGGKKANIEEPDLRSGKGDDEQTAGDRRSFWQTIRSHKLAVGIVAMLIVAALAGLTKWWVESRHYESTDDAFIDGRPVLVSAQVAGMITDVPVTDNQLVDAGTVLMRIDDRDYRAAVDQAQAQIEQAKAAIANSDAMMEVQQATIEQTAKQEAEAQAALTFARQENARYQDLVRNGAGTVQQAQQAASDLRQKQAAFDAATAAHEQAQRQVGVLRAQRLANEGQLGQAKAQLDLATANLSRVTLSAPVVGRVTKLTAAVGAYAVPGQTLMTLVPRDLWVTANFKETQLAHMRKGQAVTIEIDAFGRTFPGHVDSIQAGSGTAFSLLPAENATGNFVKVVQRVPVKIVFDQPPDVDLGLGLSVVPSVKVR